jgi:hypothetical protein
MLIKLFGTLKDFLLTECLLKTLL